MIVPASHQSSRATRELAQRLDRTVSDYRAEHPKATDAEVSMALHTVLQRVSGARGLSPAQAIALGLGLSAVMGMIGIVAKVGSHAGVSLVGPLLATFAVVVLAVVFIAARHNG